MSTVTDAPAGTAEALIRVFQSWKQLALTDEESPGQLHLLLELRTLGATRVSTLAATVRLDTSTVTRHVQVLERAGLVERISDPDDRRACLISLSAQGNDTLDRRLARRRSQLEAATAGWSAQDRAHLIRLLNRLAGDIDVVAAAARDPE